MYILGVPNLGRGRCQDIKDWSEFKATMIEFAKNIDENAFSLFWGSENAFLSLNLYDHGLLLRNRQHSGEVREAT
ncbi:hypothetical protein N7478_009142 [Penicillium angulare]|uniref:uncharacterized protein n=1 Tax=Penicillium angulare TaxID=116970 RepID=UPI002541BF51|nr:uncharacterized protein N7478_009142 [Penicillium angulare]KAJ5274017.1 hypothetical protein N7478_009142 [Penicillium angulare]